MMIHVPVKVLLMKQLLLLITIHFIIFHQREKDRQEKVFVALEQKKAAAVSASAWEVHPVAPGNNLNAIKGFFGAGPVYYSLTNYHFLSYR
jgi:hypothetical protein